MDTKRKNEKYMYRNRLTDQNIVLVLNIKKKKKILFQYANRQI